MKTKYNEWVSWTSAIFSSLHSFFFQLFYRIYANNSFVPREMPFNDLQEFFIRNEVQKWPLFNILLFICLPYAIPALVCSTCGCAMLCIFLFFFICIVYKYFLEHEDSNFKSQGRFPPLKNFLWSRKQCYNIISGYIDFTSWLEATQQRFREESSSRKCLTDDSTVHILLTYIIRILISPHSVWVICYPIILHDKKHPRGSGYRFQFINGLNP